jgi:NTP pyrophosphatase (non-canonical NTP hydrolase)
MEPIHKFNNGRGAMLCLGCRTIISTGPKTEELFCTACKEKYKIMKHYGELEALVIAWATQKGILENGTPRAQAMKTWEETDELITAIENDDRAEIIDALGDILVTIIIQAEMQGLKLTECLESAYNVISKRTGKMIGGQFVKDDTGHPGFNPNNASHT